MGFFDKLFPKEDIKSIEVVPVDPQQFIYPVTTEYRKGMWVKTAGSRIGILAKFLDNGLAEVSLTDAKGHNIATEEHQVIHLVRARRSEIPEARINHLSRNELRALGYED